jgi:hypothetical protein
VFSVICFEKQSYSSDVTRRLAGQEIPSPLSNPKAHSGIHKSPIMTQTWSSNQPTRFKFHLGRFPSGLFNPGFSIEDQYEFVKCVTCNSSFNYQPDAQFLSFFKYFITFLYMFRALLCSSPGGQIVSIQHLVSSLSVSGYCYTRMHGQENINKSQCGKWIWKTVINTTILYLYS